MFSSESNPQTSPIEQELEAVYRLYAALARQMDPENGLGGKLLYAGEADEPCCRLVRAANIAGMATLAASADAAILRGAMRAGAIDFVVTTLDEALRILKNEIRKRQPVAVGVSAAPLSVVREMVERGVQPDLLGFELPHEPEPCGAEIAMLEQRGAHRITLRLVKNFQIFPVPAEWARRTATFDGLLLDCLPLADHINRRWLRLAPRYLEAHMRRMRALECEASVRVDFLTRLRESDQK
jgi:hypothetical protein